MMRGLKLLPLLVVLGCGSPMEPAISAIIIENLGAEPVTSFRVVEIDSLRPLSWADTLGMGVNALDRPVEPNSERWVPVQPGVWVFLLRTPKGRSFGAVRVPEGQPFRATFRDLER